MLHHIFLWMTFYVREEMAHGYEGTRGSIAGSLIWLSEAEHVQMSFRSMKHVPY